MSGVVAWIGVGAFGTLGAYARFRVSETVRARRPGVFPLGTFAVNSAAGSRSGC